jgi:fumarate reductase subunit D
MAAPKSEPFWWLLFSAGGMMSALFLPGHVLWQGIAMPMGWVPAEARSYERMHALLSHPIAKLYLLALISLSLFHAGHRLKHAVHDLGFEAKGFLAVLFYGAATVCTAVAAYALVRI